MQCPEAPGLRRKEEAEETRPLEEQLKIFSIRLAAGRLRRGCVPHVFPGPSCLFPAPGSLTVKISSDIVVVLHQKDCKFAAVSSGVAGPQGGAQGLARGGRNAQCGTGDPAARSPPPSYT